MHFVLLQIEEVKKKETYAVAKALLEKYGEIITPEVRSPSPVENTNKGMWRSSMLIFTFHDTQIYGNVFRSNPVHPTLTDQWCLVCGVR